MDLLYLLTHDTREHIVANIDITTIIQIELCCKSMPNILRHLSKDLFLNEMHNTFQIIRNSKKIISYIYDNQFVIHDTIILNKKTFKRAIYPHGMIIGSKNIFIKDVAKWTQKNMNLIDRIITATINRDNSYLFFSMFIDGTPYIETEIVYESFKKNNMLDLFNTFWNNIFEDKRYGGHIACPWLSIPLIMNDKYWIEQALTTYAKSPYTLHTNSLKRIYTACLCSCNTLYMHDYIAKFHPEFIPLLQLINDKEPN